MTSLKKTLCATTLTLATLATSSMANACGPTGGCATKVRPTYHPTYRTVTTHAKAPANDARTYVALAKRDFAAGRYPQALVSVDKALKLLPKDANLHQFRSLCLFAQAEYKPAAAAAYTAFTLGNAWTWETLRSFYNGTNQYTAQYHLLAKAAKYAPESADTHFLLAYHHLMLGHRDAGRRELEKAAELLPGDPVVTGLLKVLGGSTAAATEAPSVEVTTTDQ